MAQIISVDVYNFDSIGNRKVNTQLMGLPVAGAFVTPIPAANQLDPSVFVYSKISYPGYGPATPYANGFVTAETVAQILTKMNA